MEARNNKRRRSADTNNAATVPTHDQRKNAKKNERKLMKLKSLSSKDQRSSLSKCPNAYECGESKCSFCNNNICEQCLQKCCKCCNNFCTDCSVTNYDERLDRIFCMDCDINNRKETKALKFNAETVH